MSSGFWIKTCSLLRPNRCFIHSPMQYLRNGWDAPVKTPASRMRWPLSDTTGIITWSPFSHLWPMRRSTSLLNSWDIPTPLNLKVTNMLSMHILFCHYLLTILIEEHNSDHDCQAPNKTKNNIKKSTITLVTLNCCCMRVMMQPKLLLYFFFTETKFSLTKNKN